MNGICASSNTGIIAMRRAGGGAADHRDHLVVLDQPRGEGARGVGVAAIVIDDEFELLPVHAALGLLISSTYISSVFFSGSPRNEAGPVTESDGADLDLRNGDARCPDHGENAGGGGEALDGETGT